MTRTPRKELLAFMRYVSLFSGIEAATVAFEPLGWEPVAFCEIDEFPSAVLAHHYPDVPNLGDITKVDWHEFKERYGAVSLVVGGSPCQSFSISGGRESLQGESRLMFEYIRAVGDLRPDWFLWENVPGCLNTKDDAFGQLLREMEHLGYKDLAWRVLDAQFARVPVRDDMGRVAGWFGPVAQRRRRVFLVGHLGAGGGFASAAVLFEPEGVRGNHPSSREKRKALAADAGRRAQGADPVGGGVTAFKYAASASAGTMPTYDDGSCNTLTADWHAPAVAMGRGAEDGTPQVVAFAQNTRDEVRVQGDGTVVGALSASPGMKQQTYVMQPSQDVLCMASGQANAEADVDVSPTLTLLHEAPVLCMASSNANAEVGGGSLRR